MIGPSDFAPYRAEFVNCECATCREVAYARSDVLDMRGRRHLAACEALLAALRNGTHRRVEWTERAAEVRAERAATIAAACAAGRSEGHIATLHRGYATTRDRETYPYGPAGPMRSREFVIGSGLGMTPGAYEAREKTWNTHVKAANAERAIQVARLIAQDQRNLCAYFRLTGQLCTHHGEASK